MANICEFEMVIKGDPKDIDRFIDALSQKENIWMGRGAYIGARAYGERSTIITGECKWSLQSSLVDCAVSMQKQAAGGEVNWGDLPENGEFLTIFEACEKYHVNMEVYSSEPGLAFQEHLKYENGKVENDSVPFEEVWDDETLEVVDTIGGYESWDFTVADVTAA